MRLPWRRPSPRREVVLARDPNSGFAAIYLDGELLFDFDDDPFGSPLWDDALTEVLGSLGVVYETNSRHQLARKIEGFDYVEYDGYWPQRLEDAPLEEWTAPINPVLPHEFEGISFGTPDRPCSLEGCGKADRHPVHSLTADAD